MTQAKDAGKRLLWLEVSKAIALVLIVFNHALERMDIYPFIFNPEEDWAPFADRLAQLEPTTGSAWDLAFNALRYPGLLGEVGVQIFVIASGLGLTLSAMRRGAGDGFLRRRVRRIAPTWVTVHLLALIASVPVLLFIGGGAADLVAAPWDARFWASLVGFRITPETIYYLVPAWWFIALLIQLYLVFPVLYRWFVRLGPNRFWYVIGGSILIKAAGLVVFSGYLDVWSRGAIFVTRLPEFAFGMMVAHWLTAEDNPLQRSSALLAAVIAVPVGVVSGLYLIGNAWGPFLFGAGLFALIYRLFTDQGLRGRIAAATIWVGRHSLALFVVHQPIYFVLMPGGMAGPARVLGAFVVAAAVTVVAGIVLEWIVARAERVWDRWRGREVLVARVGLIAVVCLVVYGSVVAADLWIRSTNPQEVLGWGERPSLVIDDTLGWRLDPNQTTRLQWQSYDYEVTANRYGFPGPAESPSADHLRVLTLGDAFTSAEGVDTGRAWPRLLEAELGATTVWNGAVSGYGPHQYALAAQELAPKLDPDVIIVGFFVNDFADGESEYEDMHDSIGFDRPDATGIVASLQWGHISKYLRYNFTEPVLAIAGLPNRTGYLLGQFDAFDPGAITPETEGYVAAVAAMEKLSDVAPDARRLMLLVPASIQVCDPVALAYFPDNVSLADYDLEQPQRLAADVAAATGMEVIDLRPVLRAAPDCPYQPENMHWLEHGHELVAQAVAEMLDG